MIYFLRENTLFIRGIFKGASTGVRGGICNVSTIFNHTVPKSFSHTEPHRYMKSVVAEQGFSTEDFFGLLTAVEMKTLCVFSYEFITVFITAGVSNPNPDGPGTINIIIHSREGLSDGALLEMVITATEAKAQALHDMGYDFTGTTTDAVVAVYEDDKIVHEYAGTLTEAGKRVYECVRFGLPEALKRHEGIIETDNESFFVLSTIGGNHWVEWKMDECPYYPCHFEGQRCDFCYCPFYPCKDIELGDWVESSTGKKVWSCQRCRLVHYPEVVDYLKRKPEAPLSELKALAVKK